MESLKEYAKYINEQCNKICGFFVDEYGEAIEMYHDIVFVSILSRINAHSSNNHCTCDVEYDVYFNSPNNHDNHTQVMKETIFNRSDTQNILAEIRRRGEVFARLLVQEQLNMNVEIHEITSTYDLKLKRRKV